MVGFFILLNRRFLMNAIYVSGSRYSESASSITTTLYDLMTLIDAQQSGKSRPGIGPDAQRPDTHGHSDTVTERVTLMFESGQIRFRNPRDFKKNYAEFFKDEDPIIL
jgi:hypothetical protein